MAGVAGGVAHAHQLQVLDRGGELDVGLADPARLVHAALLEDGDQLRITATAPDRGPELEVRLLLPAQRWEDGLRSTELPRLTIDGRAARSPRGKGGDELVDDMTGIAYVELSSGRLPAGSGSHELVVQRGRAAARVALRIGDPGSDFMAIDADQTPRAAVRTRIWAESPPGGPEADKRRPEPRTDYAIFGGALTLAALVVAAWWVRSGRTRARRSGIERAARGRRDPR